MKIFHAYYDLPYDIISLLKWGGIMSDLKNKKKPAVGGQALIEGVMMVGPEGTAIAVRKPDMEIVIDKQKRESITKRYKLLGLPFIRGSVTLVESLVTGINALNYSAGFYEEEEGEPGRFEKFLTKLFGDKLEKVVMTLSLIISFVFAAGLFFILPTAVIKLVGGANAGSVWKNLIEGIIRITIFVLYVLSISLMKDIKRVFQYHGAEHKSVYCFESGEELTVENARKYSTLHPRCGTNFLFLVMLVSILLFSFLGWPGIAVRIASRILLIPVIAGVSYEILRFLGRTESNLVHALIYPGLLLQKLTTREPDDSQIEVALAALKEVIPVTGEAEA
jgi:uncharacterized protein YqhQ